MFYQDKYIFIIISIINNIKYVCMKNLNYFVLIIILLFLFKGKNKQGNKYRYKVIFI